jgi:hypothetical protein
MAVALLGYFSTMVTAFVGLMLLLNTVLSSSLLQHTRPRPYPTPLFAEAVVPDQQPAINQRVIRDETANVETPKPVVGEKKSTRVKIARDQRRNEDLAGRQQDRQYSLALGYAPNGQKQPGALFDMFGTRRF